MKSNICAFKKNSVELKKILEETDKVAQYNNLSRKESLRLRLLAEEMVVLLKELIEKFEGEYYVESDGKKYELHSVLTIPTMTAELRNELIEFSSSKSNEASKGILGKIRNAFDVMMLNLFENEHYYAGNYYDCFDYNACYEWTLNSYIESNKTKKEVNDELQKSIIGSLADDVVVSIKGGKVNIVISKEFK